MTMVMLMMGPAKITMILIKWWQSSDPLHVWLCWLWPLLWLWSWQFYSMYTSQYSFGWDFGGIAIMDLKTLTLFQFLCLRGILDKQWTPSRARKGSCSIVQDKNRKEGIGDGYPGGEIVADIPMEMLFLHSKVYWQVLQGIAMVTKCF